MDARDALVIRLREHLAEEPVTREIAMFGGRAFMLNEKMACCAFKGGDLLVRIDAAEHDELLDRPGAAPMVMGADRVMGPGWIVVDSGAIDDEESLQWWLEKALAYNRAVTGRG
ncbi:MAG: TfoX/Sxy family protein [Gordonia sp. (in: high G+C Gram-positive bacteria)]|uniref:TfoX/Sxy family protein n=1 Tax=Gordonia sp. (in: high G+C Gram-positive bacteria) TaxID=84139 RepID=UPI0039E3154E